MASGPLGFVAMVLFYCAWPKAEYLPTIQRRSWKDMDFLGSFLVIAASVLVTFAFQNAGTNETDVDPWAKGTFIGPLVVGVVSWIALFAWEGAFERIWSQKMAAIPLVLIRNHVFAAATLNTILLGFAYLATLYAVPLRLQVVNGKSPIMAGVLMLPMLGATGIGSVISGIVSKKQNRLSETMTVATIMVTLGLALETTVSDSQELEPKFLGFLTFIGLGYGMITSSATMFTAIEAPIPEHGKSQDWFPSTQQRLIKLFSSARTRHHRPVANARREHRHCHVLGDPRSPATGTACWHRLTICAAEPGIDEHDGGAARGSTQDVQRLVHYNDEGMRHRRGHRHPPHHGHVPSRQDPTAAAEGEGGPSGD